MSAMHDDPAVFPTLPGRATPIRPDVWRMCVDSQTDPAWKACWEYVLTHDLNDTEGAAFWHGALIAHKALTEKADR